MFFSVGTILLVIGYLWYAGTAYDRDWRDFAKLVLISVGSGLMLLSVLTLAWQYLP